MEIVRKLLGRGANVNAAEPSDLDIVRKLLVWEPVYMPRPGGLSLMWACYKVTWRLQALSLHTMPARVLPPTVATEPVTTPRQLMQS